MRTIFSLSLALLALPLGAQDTDSGEKFGFIRLVNAVAPGEGRLDLYLDGSLIFPDGYALGDATGGIGVAVGRCKVMVKREGVKEGETSVDVRQGETTTVIPFAEQVPASDDEPAHWQIRILRLRQEEREDGRNATFISVSREPEMMIEIGDPDGTWNKVPLKRFSTARAPLNWPKGYAPLRVASVALPPIPIIDDGNYVCVLYDDPDGEVKAISFRDFRHLTAD